MNGDFLRFKEAAMEMEQYAIALFRRSLTLEEADAANLLLRHARGILAWLEKWRILE